MKPFEALSELENIKRYLTNDKKYSRRKDLVQNEIDRIDRITKITDALLNDYFDEDIFSTLVLTALSLKMRLESKSDQIEIHPVEMYMKEFISDIRNGSVIKLHEVSDQMKEPYETMLLKDFEKTNDTDRVGRIMNKMPTNDANKKVLKELVNIIKSEICVNTAMKNIGV